MLETLEHSEGVLVWIGIFGVGAFVVSLAAYFMRLRGLSLKPIWWFSGFLLFIGLPQFLGHLAIAISSARGSTSTTVHAKFIDAESLLSHAPEGSSVVEIQPQMAAGVLADAEKARFVTFPNQDTVLVARFAAAQEMEGVVENYLREADLMAAAASDGHGGFVVRGSGDRLLHIHAGAGFLIVENSTDKMAAAREQNGDLGNIISSTIGKTATVVVLLAYVFVVSVYFLKGLAWATRVDANPSADSVSANILRERLLALNNLDVPFRIDPTGTDGDLHATWRYADAKWIDLARAQGMRRLHRIVLALDEVQRKIRATDYQTAYDWSAGRGGANLVWNASTGIVLFQYEHQRLFGLQLDDRGRPTMRLDYSYTFDLQEMKAPLIDAVTRSGWHWQPVAWQAPHWLRWMTE